MNPVGIVSIALGAFAVCTRVPLVIAPGPALRWFKRVVSTDGRVRLLGVGFLPFAVTMIWAGSLDDSGLASVLLLIGMGAAGLFVLFVLPFPGAFRRLFDEMTPSQLDGSLVGWRIVGLAVVVGGLVLIYFGVLAV